MNLFPFFSSSSLIVSSECSSHIPQSRHECAACRPKFRSRHLSQRPPQSRIVLITIWTPWLSASPRIPLDFTVHTRAHELTAYLNLPQLPAHSQRKKKTNRTIQTFITIYQIVTVWLKKQVSHLFYSNSDTIEMLLRQSDTCASSILHVQVQRLL